MKIHTKKKRYQLFCKRQAQKGLVNRANGEWETTRPSDRMHLDYLAGHRVGRR